MNIYQKINQARLELQGMNLKKSGKNNFAGFSYYELADLLPAINNVCSEIGIATHIDVYETEAVLKIVDTEKEDQFITFTVPTADVSLKGGQDIQNLGAKITYLRRYLIMNAFEIIEHDTVDAQPPKETKKEVKTLGKEQIESINATQTIEELKELSSKLIKEFGSKAVVPYYKKRGKELTDAS